MLNQTRRRNRNKSNRNKSNRNKSNRRRRNGGILVGMGF